MQTETIIEANQIWFTQWTEISVDVTDYVNDFIIFNGINFFRECQL